MYFYFSFIELCIIVVIYFIFACGINLILHCHYFCLGSHLLKVLNNNKKILYNYSCAEPFLMLFIPSCRSIFRSVIAFSLSKGFPLTLLVVCVYWWLILSTFVCLKISLVCLRFSKDIFCIQSRCTSVLLFFSVLLWWWTTIFLLALFLMRNHSYLCSFLCNIAPFSGYL